MRLIQQSKIRMNYQYDGLLDLHQTSYLIRLKATLTMGKKARKQIFEKLFNSPGGGNAVG